MPRRTSDYGALTSTLLQASLLCGLKPHGPPAYRLQLFFVANRDLGSRSHQSDFQRAIETAVDRYGLWDNYGQRGSGEYIITGQGYRAACDLYGDVRSRYTPARATDFTCRLEGTVDGVAVEIIIKGTRSRVRVDRSQMQSAKAACQWLESRTDLSLPTEGDSAARVLYNMAVDKRFVFGWGSGPLSGGVVAEPPPRPGY